MKYITGNDSVNIHIICNIQKPKNFQKSPLISSNLLSSPHSIILENNPHSKKYLGDDGIKELEKRRNKAKELAKEKAAASSKMWKKIF